jgi:methyltransferase OMS1
LLDSNAEKHSETWGSVWNRDIDEIVKQAGLEVEYLKTWHFGTTYYIRCKAKSASSEAGGVGEEGSLEGERNEQSASF